MNKKLYWVIVFHLETAKDRIFSPEVAAGITVAEAQKFFRDSGCEKTWEDNEEPGNVIGEFSISVEALAAAKTFATKYPRSHVYVDVHEGEEMCNIFTYAPPEAAL